MSPYICARLNVAAILMFLFLCAVVDTGRAEVPRMIQYQGRLTSDTGVPLDTALALTFTIFDDSAGGTALWTETHSTVIVTEGLFDVLLGSVAPLNTGDFSGKELWLAIAIGGEQLKTRTPVVSTAYSFRSEYTAQSHWSKLSDTADYAIRSRRADTATIALNASGNGWVDGGATLHLETITDRVGIGVAFPYEKLEVDGNLKVTAGNSVYFGNDNNRITGSSGVPANLTLYAQSDMWLRPSADLGIRRGSQPIFAQFDLGQRMLGLGTTSPEEILHVENDASGGRAFIKIQTSNATTFGETGLRFETPQNRWHFRMDDYTNNNLASGALGLRSQNLGAEVMVWNENGNVGVGTTSPAYKLDVNGAARANGTFYATNLIINDDAVINDTLFAGALEADLVNAKNIVDETGFSSIYSSSLVSLTGSFANYLTNTITVPAAGYIMAIGTAQIWLDHGITGTSWGAIAVSDMPNSLNGSVERSFFLSSAADAGYYGAGIACQKIFPVASAGTYTYYLVADRGDDNPAEIGGRQLDLIYFPTVYSGGSASEEIFDDILSPAPEQDDPNRHFARKISASADANTPSSDTSTELANEIKSLKAEIEALKSRLQVIEDK